MPEGDKTGENGAADKGDLDALLQKIYDEHGYDFREYKRASVQRRIGKRLSDTHTATYGQYAALLGRDPGEYAKLLDTLLINVSSFFRDPGAWAALDADVLPKLLAGKAKGCAIRIWCAGCSTGEEPYTVAILLAERLGGAIADHEIRIYATDIDDKALDEARRGVYAGERLGGVKDEYLDRYFTRENGFYKVRPSLRRMVAFGRLDLVPDAPISRLDLIICRNVLIYFMVDLQNRILLKFHAALNPNGYLFLGKSESILAGSRLFQPVDKGWRIFKKGPGATPAAAK